VTPVTPGSSRNVHNGATGEGAPSNQFGTSHHGITRFFATRPGSHGGLTILGHGRAHPAWLPVCDAIVCSRYFPHFPADHREAALDWVVAPDDHPGRFELIDGLPGNIVAVEVKGIVTAQDCEEMLMPLVTEKLKKHDRLNILLLAGEDFQSFSAGAIWDDTRFGLMHLADFGKIALVSDTGRMRHGAKLFAPFIRGSLHVFSLAELDDAKEWVKR